MTQCSPQLVTELLGEWSRGNEEALRDVIPLVHTELRRMAARYLRSERQGHTLEPTALVHEAYLRLTEQRRTTWRSRAHFLAVASGLMRRILVDHARRRRYLKRGGGRRPITLTAAAEAIPDRPADVIALDEALDDLEKMDPRQRRIVELRFFGGLTHEDIALALGISLSSVERQWRLARAWLYRRLAAAASEP
jgi:RNA polymerase sigma factor (TIGR02999 family)